MEHKYTCKICNYETPTRWCIISHLQRKRPCGVSTEWTREQLLSEINKKEYNDITFDCMYCERKFNDQSNRSKHYKVCKHKTSSSKAAVSTVTVDATEFETMKNDLLEMKATIQNLINEKKVTNINGNQYNTINVQLNNYGQESTSHLTHDFLSHCLLNPKKGIQSLIESIHYNKELPENHNIRCKSLKNNVFEKHIDSVWRVCDASNTLDELIKKGYRIMNAHYMEHYMNDPSICEDEFKQKMYGRFRFLSDTNSNEYFAVRRELRLLVKDRTMYVLSCPDAQDDDDTEGQHVEDDAIASSTL